MQALELGDKAIANKIKSLICNFCPDSPAPISVHIPCADENSAPDISFSYFDSDSPMMTRLSKPSGSRQKALKVPRASLLDAQTTIDSEVEDHR